MPLPRLQTMLLFLSMLTLVTLLFYLSFTTFAPSASHAQATSSFLFPASAVISLTDDNSTFFISRPAAFGPPLPKNGMDGELFVLAEGQLACDDTPGWDPSASPDISMPLFPEGVEDDGTDNILNPVIPSTLSKTTVHADIESLQESAEIEGKIVLVQRGGCGFLEKVLWAQRRGGIALVVGDFKRSGIVGGSSGLVTMYAKGDTSNVSIPSLFTSHTTAALLTTLLPKHPRPSSAAAPVRSSTKSAMPKPTATLSYRDWLPGSPQLANDDQPQLNDDQPQLNDDQSQLNDDTVPQNEHKHGRPLPVLTTDAPSPTATKAPSATVVPAAERTGLWITLTPTTMTSSPFFDTLLVLVVSPLVTLTLVYTLLLVRSRVRRRRWRAPKSLVERLPVRTYQSTSSPASATFPPRSSSLLAAPAVDALPRIPTSPTTQFAGRAFHHRWSGCNECVVCLEEYVDGVSKVMKLPCGHEFHVGCITPWLTTRRRTCPICKGDVVRGVRAISESEMTGDGADETTPLVLAVDEDDEEGDLEGGVRG